MPQLIVPQSEIVRVEDLPIARIIWAGTDRSGQHDNHLHVEGNPAFKGTPPANNPGMSLAVQLIYQALKRRFGSTAYFLADEAKNAEWTHMGWYNRRKIAGSSTWSQHAWSNALDVGPYWYVAEQKRFYDFLTGRDRIEDMLTEHELKELKDLVKALDELGSNGYGFAKWGVTLIRKERDRPLHKPESTSGIPKHRHTVVIGDPI